MFRENNVDTLRKCTIFCQEPLSYGSFIIELALTLMGAQSKDLKIFQGGWKEYRSVPEPNYELAGGYNVSTTQHFENILAQQPKELRNKVMAQKKLEKEFAAKIDKEQEEFK